MISFFVCLGLLILSYFTYAKYVERVFGPTADQTPAVRFANGVDYVPMPLWRMVLGRARFFFLVFVYSQRGEIRF